MGCAKTAGAAGTCSRFVMGRAKTADAAGACGRFVMGFTHCHQNNTHYGQRQSDQLLSIQVVVEEQHGDDGDQRDPQPLPEREGNTVGDCFGGFGQQQIGEGDEQPHRQIVEPAGLVLRDHGHAGGPRDLGQDGARQEDAGQEHAIE